MSVRNLKIFSPINNSLQYSHQALLRSVATKENYATSRKVLLVIRPCHGRPSIFTFPEFAPQPLTSPSTQGLFNNDLYHVTRNLLWVLVAKIE